MINIFFERINHSTPINWFESAFKLWGIDIKNYHLKSIINKHGLQIFKNPNYKIIMYRFEDLKKNLNLMLKVFKIDKIKLKNISSLSWYKDIYHNFLDKVRFTEEYIDRLYNTDVMRYFYTDEEINTFSKKWLRN